MKVNTVRDQTGLTLLELMVGLALMGMVAAIIAQSINLGIRAWEKGNTISQNSHSQVFDWQLIVRQIRSFYPAKGENNAVYFTGKKNEISFVSAYSLRWADQAGLMRVIYKVDDESSEDIARLLVFEEPLISAKRLEEEVSEDEFIELTSSKGEIEFAYEDVSPTQTSSDSDSEWKTKWPGNERSVPKRIKITIPRNSENDDNAEYELIVPIIAQEDSPK